MFLAGGDVVAPADLRYAAETKSVEGLAGRLARRAAGTPLAAALSSRDRDPDDAALDAAIAAFRRRSLRDSLGASFVILYVLRLRAEHRALRRILWQLALGVPEDRRVRPFAGAAA